MPHHEYRSASGTITHVFAHRFVLRTARGVVLADLTPRGLDQIVLQIGDDVTIEGEIKPSEIKVARLVRDGKSIVIDHERHGHHDRDHHPAADPAVALTAARAAGFEVLDTPRRKPKHFEVLGRQGDVLTELHIELDGHIRKTKPVAADDPKWPSPRDATV